MFVEARLHEHGMKLFYQKVVKLCYYYPYCSIDGHLCGRHQKYKCNNKHLFPTEALDHNCLFYLVIKKLRLFTKKCT